MRKNSFLCLLILSFYASQSIYAQGRLGINTDGSSADASALLDLKSSTQGLLVPRMLDSERATILSPATGLIVYQTNGTNPGFYYYNGSVWTNLKTVAPFETTGNVTRNENGDYATDDYVFGAPSLDYDSDTDHQDRFFFDKGLGAFRAGRANTTAWDAANVGEVSIALGQNVTASGPASVSIGSESIASGSFSVALGSNCDATNYAAFAFGTSNNATGQNSTAFGNSNNATGLNSTSFGNANNVSGNYATAFGRGNTASGEHSTVMGRGNTGYSYGETVVGLACTAYTPQSTTTHNSADRIFVVGNGIPGFFGGTKSDALIVYKDGTISFDENTSTPAITTDRLYNLNGDLYFDGTQLQKDDMGNHTASQVLNLNGHYLSGDSDAEGIYVDVSGNITLSGQILQDAVTAPSFQNSWTDYGNGYEATGYYQDKSGRVHLEGVITAGVIGTAAFTLPPNYAPLNIRTFHAISYDGANTVLGRIDIWPTGEVMIEIYGGAYISLDGISF